MIETLMGMLKNHYHLTGKVGGWIYRSDGSPICHGWVSFAKLIQVKHITLEHHPFIHWENADSFLKPKKKTGKVYTEMNWVTYNTDIREVIGCRENDDGSMTPVQTVGTYQVRDDGHITAKINLDGVQIRVTGKSFKDLTWTLGDVLERHYQEQVRCSPCEGTGLFDRATWDHPEVPCDYCNGTGEDNPEVTE